MHFRINNHQNFFTGIFFSTLGSIVAYGSLKYPLGSAMRMGPGYFPLLLAATLVVIGLFVIAQALAIDNAETRRIESLSLRPITLIAAGVLLFAFSVQSLGLIVATIGLVTVSGVAYKGFRWSELAILGLTLSAFAVGVFAYGLRLPFQALPV